MNDTASTAMKFSRLRRSGFRIGPLGVTWTDLWTGNHGLEIYWPLRFYRCWGFGKNPWEAGSR